MHYSNPILANHERILLTISSYLRYLISYVNISNINLYILLHVLQDRLF